MFGKSFKKEIKVEGMKCNHCAEKVEKQLKTIKGVKKVEVDLVNKKVLISSSSELSDDQLHAKIEALGYTIID